MNNELIVFTHNDLDAIGCMLNIEYKWPNVRKKFFYTNYANIPAQVDEIIRYADQNQLNHIIIPDVSFSDNKESLRVLYNRFPHITHIDHHQYPNGFWDEFPNMKVVYDKSKCATKLCNEYFGNEGKHVNLDKLTYLIDVYDIWQSKNKHFDLAQDLNRFFWTYDIFYLFEKIVHNDYKLPESYKYEVEVINKKWKSALESYEKRNLVHRAGDVSIAFVSDYFNELNLQEMKNGANIVIGVNKWGIVKFRISEDSPYTTEVKKSWRKLMTGNEHMGHDNAFTWKLECEPTFDNIMSEIENIVNIINNTKGKF